MADDELNNPDLPYEDFYEIKPTMYDMIQQFKKGNLNNILADETDRQLEELRYAVYTISAFVNLDVAEEKILDAIGDILCLSRADAAKLITAEEYTLLEDEEYRMYLKYQSAANVAQGTYQDIVDEIKLILGDDYSVMFIESEEHPGTVIVEIGNLEGQSIPLDKLPILKPAGVSLSYSISPYMTEIHVSPVVDRLTRTGICCGLRHMTDASDTKYYNQKWQCGQYIKKYVEELKAGYTYVYE
ncbi:MAG: DUF2612 domain-containing protein [Clostridia bacterium]|nr:DUF2612 domain-containing protein [Clostridia bacterium]